MIKAITERLSSRIFRVVALPAPSDREKTQMYSQRYMRHFPAAGEVIIFDRSWYNRAGVERVMGFCSEDQLQPAFLANYSPFRKQNAARWHNFIEVLAGSEQRRTRAALQGQDRRSEKTVEAKPH